MLRPKRPVHLNQKLSKWWILALLGVCLAAIIIYIFVFLIPGFFDGSISRVVERSDMDDQKKIDFLIEKEALVRDSLVLISRYMGILLAWVVIMSFLVAGLVLEERKGYRRVIEKLQVKLKSTDLLK